MKIQQPKPGSSVGIIAPANTMADLSPAYFEVGKKRLESLGFNVKVGKNANGRFGHTSGTIEERLEDFNSMLYDPKVSIIMPVFGGYNSIDLLDRLPYADIARLGKPIIGYSDTTALLVGINISAKIPTFHGPAFASFCDPSMQDWAIKSFTSALQSDNVVTLADPQLVADDPWYLKSEKAKRDFRPHSWKTYSGGQVRGEIFGGNADTLLSLAGTPFFPESKNKILLLEHGFNNPAGLVDRDLAQLKHMGVLDNICGLILGIHNKITSENIYQILTKHLPAKNKPVLYDVNCSHVDPLFTLPIGIPVNFDATQKTIQFETHYISSTRESV